MPTMHSLRLFFESIKYSAENDPFRDWDNDWPARRLCQKILVDWILSFAKPFIEHIPEIQLAGSIEHSTRQKWEKIFADQKRGIRSEVDVAAIKSLPEDNL